MQLNLSCLYIYIYIHSISKRVYSKRFKSWKFDGWVSHTSHWNRNPEWEIKQTWSSKIHFKLVEKSCFYAHTQTHARKHTAVTLSFVMYISWAGLLYADDMAGLSVGCGGVTEITISFNYQGPGHSLIFWPVCLCAMGAGTEVGHKRPRGAHIHFCILTTAGYR